MGKTRNSPHPFRVRASSGPRLIDGAPGGGTRAPHPSCPGPGGGRTWGGPLPSRACRTTSRPCTRTAHARGEGPAGRDTIDPPRPNLMEFAAFGTHRSVEVLRAVRRQDQGHVAGGAPRAIEQGVERGPDLRISRPGEALSRPASGRIMCPRRRNPPPPLGVSGLGRRQGGDSLVPSRPAHALVWGRRPPALCTARCD